MRMRACENSTNHCFSYHAQIHYSPTGNNGDDFVENSIVFEFNPAKLNLIQIKIIYKSHDYVRTRVHNIIIKEN